MKEPRVAVVGGRFKLRKLLLVPLLFVALPLLFLIEENLRGRIGLNRYLRGLAARGEKLSASEFMSRSSAGENGASEVMAAAKELKPGLVLPTNPPPRMKLLPSGRVVVCFREERWQGLNSTNGWEQVARDLSDNEAVLGRIQAALAKPVLNCEFDPTLGPRARFPQLPVPKQIIQWLGPRTMLGLRQGKSDETTKDLLTEIDLPRFLASDGIVISELVRHAAAALARGDTWEALQADAWRDADLKLIQRAWEKQEFAAPMTRALEGERIFAQSTYDLMRKSNEETVGIIFGLEEFSPEEPTWWHATLQTLPGGAAIADFVKKQVYCRIWRFAWLHQEHLHYLRYLERMIDLSREAAREKSVQNVELGLATLVLENQNHGIYDRLRYPSANEAGTLSRALHRAMRAETERSLVLAAIALKRYRLRNGKPPATLGELVPEFLAVEPVDWMDGKPLKYRREQEEGFLLYSVGEDGEDDGGDASLLTNNPALQGLWNRKDAVWPAPATAAEIEEYRAGQRK
jgi:hypothetical protein